MEELVVRWWLYLHKSLCETAQKDFHVIKAGSGKEVLDPFFFLSDTL